jgi:hypothetical protein
MLSRLLALLGSSVALLATSLSHAQCAKDTDCKADRVCEAGTCVAPVAAPAAALAAQPPAAPPNAQAPAPVRVDAPRAPAVKMERHSTGMMAGGIVMLSLAPVALVVSGFARLAKVVCDADRDVGCDEDYDPTIYGALLTGVALVGVGIPLVVIGAKKEPVEAPEATATISPWATPNGAGVGLRIDL